MSRMDSEIKITVIIPVYNVEAFVARCLNSVIKQSLFNIEIICIDDKSTDNSLNIIEEYSNRDTRIICIQNKVNRGLSYTRNVGLRQAKGEYILFLDSDDAIVDGSLEKLYKVAVSQNYQIVFFDFINKYESECLQRRLNYKDKDRSKLEGEWTGSRLFIEMVQTEDMHAQAWLKLYRRDFLLENELFFHEGIMHEDIPYAVKAMFKADKVFFIGDKLYEWWRREGSITTAKTSVAHIEGRIKGIVEIIDFVSGCELSESEQTAIEKYVIGLIRIVKRQLKGFSREQFFKKEIEYRLFLEMLMEYEQRIKISDRQRTRIMRNKTVFVYGAGEIARQFMREIQLWNIGICGVIVTTIQEPLYFYGHKVEPAEAIADCMKDKLVIVAVGQRYHKEIESNLGRLGFHNIEYLEWR